MNKYLEKIAAVDPVKLKAALKANPLAVLGGVIGGSDGLLSTRKLKDEGKLKYRLRQARNTVMGAGTGTIAGKVIQEGLKTVLK